MNVIICRFKTNEAAPATLCPHCIYTAVCSLEVTAAARPFETGLYVLACSGELGTDAPGEVEFVLSENTVDSLKKGNLVDRTRLTVTPVSSLISIPRICVSRS